MKMQDHTKTYDRVAGVLDSLVGVAEELGLNVILAKSQIPILKSLIGINEWWGELKKKRRIPEDVAKELSQQYGINLPPFLGRKTVEARLRRFAGIKNPDQAYELALKRLTARIRYKELVDFLYAAIENIQQSVVLKLSCQVRELVRALNARRFYLRPVEDVMAFFPEIPREALPQWFRKTGPIAADFQDGRIYQRPTDLERILMGLENSGVQLVEGDAATGKSVLVRSAAYKLRNQEQFNEIYYFDCGELDWDPARVFDEASDIDGLLVLENLHLEPTKADAL